MSKPLRVALTGASGQLGRAILRQAPDAWDIAGSTSTSVDLRSWERVRDWIALVRPQLVLHAGALTDVDGCESRVDDAFAVNAIGTRHVASAAARTGATLVYVSTNFVFDGTKAEPNHEFDPPNPINVYGHSKLAGEHEARNGCPGAYVVRTAMVYDETGRNFVNTMRRLMAERGEVAVVDDQRGNPTYAADLAEGIIRLVDEYPPGTYHVTNRGAATWFEWAREIAFLAGFDTTIRPIAAKDFQRAASPPANGELVSLASPEIAQAMPDWRDALRRCLA